MIHQRYQFRGKTIIQKTNVRLKKKIDFNVSLWILQDYPQLQEAMPDYFPLHEFPSLITPWQSYEHHEISPSSSYSNFPGEIEVADDLSLFGCMSPYSGYSSHMGFCGSDDMQYEGYDQLRFN